MDRRYSYRTPIPYAVPIPNIVIANSVPATLLDWRETACIETLAVGFNQRGGIDEFRFDPLGDDTRLVAALQQ